jgi:hypothetical protein
MCLCFLDGFSGDVSSFVKERVLLQDVHESWARSNNRNKEKMQSRCQLLKDKKQPGIHDDDNDDGVVSFKLR